MSLRVRRAKQSRTGLPRRPPAGGLLAMTKYNMNLLSILIPQAIFKKTSAFSGEVKVIDHVFERRLVIGGLTQSGGIVKVMWEKALNQSFVVRRLSLVKNVLILGLGAGTVTEVINKKWPEAKIVGVEIDPVIIEIGEKYFHLGDVKNLDIITDDATNYINSQRYPEFISGSNKMLKPIRQAQGPEYIEGQVQHDNRNFDLIIVDLYKGFSIEKNIQNDVFLQNLAQLLAKNGVVIFNVISSQNTNFEAKEFLDKLQRIFKDNFCKRIIANNFFFCKNPSRTT